MKIKKGTIWITIGLLLIAAALCLTGYNYLDSLRAGKAADKVVEKLDEEIPDQSDDDYIDPDYEMPTKTIDGYDYIGILEIPSKNIKLPVMDEWDYTRLRIAPCRYSGSVYSNDMVICGHNYSRHFSPIKWLHVGDNVTFTDVDGHVFQYEVASKETVDPTDVELMIKGDFDMTLFTCNTGGQTRCAIRLVLKY